MALRVFRGGCRALMGAEPSYATSSSASFATRNTAPRSNALSKAAPISPALASFVGTPEISRTDAVKKVWEYIKLHNLQNPEDKREIQCDKKLKTIFDGKDKVGFLEIAKLLSSHFVKAS